MLHIEYGACPHETERPLDGTLEEELEAMAANEKTKGWSNVSMGRFKMAQYVMRNTTMNPEMADDHARLTEFSSRMD